MTSWISDTAAATASDVLGTIGRTWPYLLVSIVAAAAVSTFVGTERVAALLRRRVVVSTLGAVALATLTPFCSCGTTALLLGMLATSAPWAPLVAFMVSSPLTSPSELVLSAGLFGWPFALTLFVGTILLGLAAGAVAHVADRAGLLHDQTRVRTGSACGDDTCAVATVPGHGPGTPAASPTRSPSGDRVAHFVAELRTTGLRLTGFFLGFTAVGYLAIEAVPTDWIAGLLGADSAFALPLAGLLGIPAYLSTEGSLPLVAALVDGGMGPGPALAFVVTGAGTSIGAITGLLVIARRRVVGLVVALLFVGALVIGWAGTGLS